MFHLGDMETKNFSERLSKAKVKNKSIKVQKSFKRPKFLLARPSIASLNCPLAVKAPKNVQQRIQTLQYHVSQVNNPSTVAATSKATSKIGNYLHTLTIYKITTAEQSFCSDVLEAPSTSPTLFTLRLFSNISLNHFAWRSIV